MKLRAGETIRMTCVASGEVYYVMKGSGESRNAGEIIEWGDGDVFCFPGGSETTHRAGESDCLLFCATDEPLLAFARLRAPAPAQAAIAATHWPAAEIDRHFETVWQRPVTDNTTGHSVQFHDGRSRARADHAAYDERRHQHARARHRSASASA